MSRRILIFGGTTAHGIMCKARLIEACYDPLVLADTASAYRSALTELPNLILVNIARNDRSWLEPVTMLRSDPHCQHIPIIALCRDDVAEESLLDALQAGVHDVLKSGTSEAVLLARIRSLMRQHEITQMVTTAWGSNSASHLGLSEPIAYYEHPGTIGLVTAPGESGKVWQKRMQGRGRHKLQLMSREYALGLGQNNKPPPEVLLIESGPGESPFIGLQMISRLASYYSTRHCSFGLALPHADEMLVTMAYDLNFNEVLTLDISPAEMELRLRALLRAKREADRMRNIIETGLRDAMIDPLTGTYNRRYAMPSLANIATRAKQAQEDFAVMVVDLDHFKAVNDRHGHAAGDTVLAEVAHRLHERLRGSDLLARIGGEEFLIVLPKTTREEALSIAESLRQAVRRRPVKLPTGERLSITTSIGVDLPLIRAMAPLEPEMDASRIIERADAALREAKACGRNRIVISADEGEAPPCPEGATAGTAWGTAEPALLRTAQRA